MTLKAERRLMSEHTPGPWEAVDRVDHTGQPELLIQTADGHEQMVVWWDTPLPDDTDKANARLIAKAPEMMEACEAMITWFEGEDEMDKKKRPSFHDLMDLCKYAEWATRKALGQEVGEFAGVPRLILVPHRNQASTHEAEEARQCERNPPSTDTSKAGPPVGGDSSASSPTPPDSERPSSGP